MVSDACQLLCWAQAVLNTQYELTENTYFDRLYIWIMLAWACPRQLNFWLQVAPSFLLLIDCREPHCHAACP